MVETTSSWLSKRLQKQIQSTLPTWKWWERNSSWGHHGKKLTIFLVEKHVERKTQLCQCTTFWDSHASVGFHPLATKMTRDSLALHTFTILHHSAGSFYHHALIQLSSTSTPGAVFAPWCQLHSSSERLLDTTGPRAPKKNIEHGPPQNQCCTSSFWDLHIPKFELNYIQTVGFRAKIVCSLSRCWFSKTANIHIFLVLCTLVTFAWMVFQSETPKGNGATKFGGTLRWGSLGSRYT